MIDSNGSQDEQFGYALALSSNGNELFVSSPHLKMTELVKFLNFHMTGLLGFRENQFWSSSDRNITGDSFGYDLSANGDFLVVGHLMLKSKRP